MTTEDKTLNCRQCNVAFVFSGDEQEFFRAKGLANEPRRCPNCRLTARLARNGQDTAKIASTICAECGVVTQVPFLPRGVRPVYCLSCHHRMRASGNQPDAPVLNLSDEQRVEIPQ